MGDGDKLEQALGIRGRAVTRSITLASAQVGDIVELWTGLAAQTCKVTRMAQGAVCLRLVDPATYEELWKEPREQWLQLRPETVCELVKRGLERTPKQRGDDGETDPLQLRRAS